MAMNKTMVFTGILTLLQAVGQIIVTGLGLSQYFCIIDFLKEWPLFLYIRILYLHNPNTCGMRINIGHSIDTIANQAFVLITQESNPVFRTFVLNSTNLFLSFVWLILGIVVLGGGVKKNDSKHIRWPWIIVTVLISVVDIVATVTFANDSFYTRTLSDMMVYIGGTASGMANVELDTAMASWTMVILSSRFVILFILNLILIILMIIDCSRQRKADDAEALVQASSPVPSNCDISERDLEVASTQADSAPRIPRPGLSQSFRKMKTVLFNKIANSGPRWISTPNSLDSSLNRSPKHQNMDADKKRSVNFPENLLSLPQRLENLIAEQQRRLDKAVIDTTGRRSPPRASQSMPQLDLNTNQPDTKSGRRGTAAELQGQLPWAYIPASVNRMRDQLPPDEDLPPVPLPDYTAIQSFRKASVHRAASSLSSITQKRDYLQAQKPPLTQSDVLY